MGKKMGRPAKISDTELTMYIRPYLKFNTTATQSQVYMLSKIDKEIAEEISKITGINIKKSQVEYYRRKNNIAACGENWGGKRDGAGRKKEYTPIPVYDGTVVIDYGSNGAVRLLHWLDTHRLSHATIFGQGLTGGNESWVTSESEDAKRLKKIVEKLETTSPEEKNILEKEALLLGIKIMGKKEMYRILNSANIDIEDEIKQILDEANQYSNHKKNKNGNRTDVQWRRAVS